MKKWLKYWMTYYTIREDVSEINGPLKVVMAMNMPRLLVGGLVQSGGLVRRIWDKAIGKIKKEKRQVKKALILGLGCGDCAFRVHKHYPEAQMLGVEIDEKIVDIAQCYFNLAILKNLTVAVDDGIAHLDKLVKKKELFDLVIVDVYLGKKMPAKFRSAAFFRQVKKILNNKGVVIYNHLFYGEYKKQAESFIKVVEKEFGKISLQRTTSNLMIFAEK